VNRVRILRKGAALAGVATLALMASVVPANADAVTGTLAGDYRGGVGVYMTGGTHKPEEVIHTSVIRLKTSNGEELQTYCIDFFTSTKPTAHYVEVPWGSYNGPNAQFGKNASKVNWVLHNSYPQVKEPDDVQNAVKAANPTAKFTHQLTDSETIAATQAALWTLSNGMVLNREHPAQEAKSADNILAVYDYLTGAANKGLDEPKPGLTLDPTKLAGKTGSLIGPFTVVATNASNVTVSATLPQGIELTDKDGNALKDAKNAKKAAANNDKNEFYVKVPEGTADGKATLDVKATAALSPGRIFAAQKGEESSQILVLAATEKVSLATKGEVSWAKSVPTTQPTTDTPAPQPKNTSEELANTGASIMTPILIGVVLVAGGAGALIFQRKRRKA
jgi:TQXA domain-containing protein/LPXTG-motif cell wall-anchored protein